MIAVGDLGGVLRWVGLLGGPAPPLRRLVSADALLGEVIEYLKVRHDSDPAAVIADLIEIQLAVHEWYPTWPVAAAFIANRSLVLIDEEGVVEWVHESPSPLEIPGANLIFDALERVPADG